MWNASELLDYALRELTEVVTKEQEKVVIVLEENFMGEEKDLQKLFTIGLTLLSLWQKQATLTGQEYSKALTGSTSQVLPQPFLTVWLKFV